MLACIGSDQWHRHAGDSLEALERGKMDGVEGTNLDAEKDLLGSGDNVSRCVDEPPTRAILPSDPQQCAQRLQAT